MYNPIKLIKIQNLQIKMVDFYQCLIIVSLGKYSKIICLLYIINIFEREKGNKGNQKSLKITKTYRDIY